MVTVLVLLPDRCCQVVFLATWTHTDSCSDAVNRHLQVLSPLGSIPDTLTPSELQKDVVTQEQDPALGLVEHYKIGLSPSIPFAQVPLNLIN